MIYQFKITLKGIRPPIWRRFQVHSDITFYELHRIIQEVMGWYDGHLHLFELGGMIITDGETLAEVWEDGVDEQRTRLPQFIRQAGQKLRYEYDFGDGWEHELLLEKILPAEAGVHYALPERETGLPVRRLRRCLGLCRLAGGDGRQIAFRT